VIVRPIPIPKLENDWQYYTSKLNITIPYPKYWKFHDIKEKEGNKIATIIYPYNQFIQFNIEQQVVPEHITIEQYNNVVEKLTESISLEKGYNQLDNIDIGNNIILHNFSFLTEITVIPRLLNMDKTISGSYCLLTFKGKMCIFITLSSENEWPDIQKLMIEVIKKSRG
jgi:hypothetical protein